jgi:hypothetical protein
VGFLTLGGSSSTGFSSSFLIFFGFGFSSSGASTSGGGWLRPNRSSRSRFLDSILRSLYSAMRCLTSSDISMGSPYRSATCGFNSHGE